MILSRGRSPVGLDIGSGYLKIVQFKDIKGGYELELFDMLPLPPELIVDGSIIDSLRLIDSMNELIRKAKIKTNVINEYLSVVKEAGLTPLIVDVNSFALENIYEINYEIEPGRNIAIVNIGASTINMNILKGGVSVFTRDSAVGSNLHTEALQREFNLTYETAEKLKKGEPVENVAPEDALPVIELASEEIVA